MCPASRNPQILTLSFQPVINFVPVCDTDSFELLEKLLRMVCFSGGLVIIEYRQISSAQSIVQRANSPRVMFTPYLSDSFSWRYSGTEFTYLAFSMAASSDGDTRLFLSRYAGCSAFLN